MLSPTCSTRDELAAYMAGKLDEERSERIEVHMPQCNDCQAAIQTAVANSQTIPIAASFRRPEFLDEPELRGALAQVQRLACDSSPTATSADTGGVGLDDDEVPEQIGPYRLLSKLGQGGMGTVYKALHTRLDRLAALKLLPPQRLRSRDAVARFEREMKAVGKLDHANIVRASDADEDDGHHYLVMELIEGVDLSELVRRAGLLPVTEACELIRQAAEGLQHAHEHGLVHRDIKPSNLMLSVKGEVKVLDLGLALLADDDQPIGLTSAATAMGTLDYMAPEQCDDSHAVDIRADIYALGATLYHLLTGEPIYAGADSVRPLQKLRALANDPPRPIQSRRGGISNELAAVVHRMIARGPANRYATPAEVAAALAPFARGADLRRLNFDGAASGATERNARASTVLPPESGPALPRRRAAAVVGLSLLAVIAAVVIYVQTAKGTLQIEIDDPKITVVCDAAGAVLRGIDGMREFRVRPGEMGLMVTVGDVTFHSETFVVKRGETTRVSVKRLPDEVQVVENGKVIGRQPLAEQKPSAPAADDGSALAPGKVLTGHGSPVVQVLFTPDGARLISVSNGDHHAFHGNVRYHVRGEDNSVRVWNAASGKEVRRFAMIEGSGYGVQGLAISPDGRLLAAGSGWIWANGPSQPRVYVWDLASGARTHHFTPPDNHAMRSVAFSSDGTKVMAVRSGQGGINTWSLSDEEPLPTVKLEQVPAVEAPRMFWSPRGALVLSSAWVGEGEFRAWDSATGQLLKQFTGHTKPPTHLDVSRDGRRVVSCAGDYSVRVWNMETAEELLHVDNLESAAHCAAFSPDGAQFVTGGEDGAVALYDATTGGELARHAGHSGRVNDVVWSPSGSEIASAGEDGTIRLWQAPPRQ